MMYDLMSVIGEIEAEFEYQDAKFSGNEKKPFEVWFLVMLGYVADTINAYAHRPRNEARKKLVKVVACGIRALMITESNG